MDDPKCCITILDSTSDNPNRQEIVYLLNGYFLPFDLLMHAVDSLDSRLDSTGNVMLLQFLADDFLNLFKKFLLNLSPALNPLVDFLIGLRLPDS